MPIKGLTDRGLAFPEIGQIRKGAKKTQNAPGADLTYFRVEFSEFEKETEAKFIARYGAQPKEINVILPFNEVERMWDAWMEAYTAGRLVARSDNEFIVYQLDSNGEILVKNGLDQNGQKVPHPTNNLAGHDYQNKPVYFKASGRLKVIVPELARAAYLTVMTTSLHDIGNISAQIDAFKTLNNGQLAGIPFVLRRRPKMVSTPGNDKKAARVRRQKWLVSIEADPVWVAGKLGQIKQLASPDFDESLLLPAPIELGEHVEDDFDDDELEGAEPETEAGKFEELFGKDPQPESAAPETVVTGTTYRANGAKIVGLVAEVANCDAPAAIRLILSKYKGSDMITEAEARKLASGNAVTIEGIPD